MQTKFEEINSCGVSVYSSLLRQTLSEVKFFKLLSQLFLRGASKGSSVKKRKDISGVEIVNLVTYWPILVGKLNLHKLVTDVFLYMVNHKGLVNMFLLWMKNMSRWSHCYLGPCCIWLFKRGVQFNWMTNLILVKFKWALGAMSPLSSHVIYLYKFMIYMGDPLIRFPTHSQETSEVRQSTKTNVKLISS